MTLTNIKTMKKDRGFTIVELLIVIVVIGILAAITIVAYSGIQNRANAATAKANAESVQKVAESYAADTTAGNGVYADQSTLSAWTGGVSRIPSGITLNNAQLTAAAAGNGKTLQYIPKGSAGAYTGACIGYWDASLATPAAAYTYVGNATTGTNLTGTTSTCS
jgi:prepilin-type N-terminal cleavage/methylation domain-containing protein